MSKAFASSEKRAAKLAFLHRDDDRILPCSKRRFCVASHGWQDGNVFVWDACGQSSPLHQFQALHSLSSFGFCNLLQLSLLDGRLVFGLFRLRSQSTSAELHWYLPALPGARSASERHRCPATSRLCGKLSMNSFLEIIGTCLALGDRRSITRHLLHHLHSSESLNSAALSQAACSTSGGHCRRGAQWSRGTGLARASAKLDGSWPVSSAAGPLAGIVRSTC